MTQYKIIFTGPVGAGKTTAINAISDAPTVKTEAMASDEVKLRKSSTTVAMDYGVIMLPDDEKIHLYGTPGQERFNFMWDILTEGGIGLILLLDNSRENPIVDMTFYLDAFADFIDKTSVAIGVTQMDVCNTPTIEHYHKQLQEMGIKSPLFAIDAREKKDVSLLVQALLYTLNPNLTE